MKKKKGIKILMIGPFPDPITGNSLANKVLYDGLIKNSEYKVYFINSSLSFFDEKVGVFSLRKAIQAIKFNIQFYKIFSAKIIYITPGQTFFGVLKYAFFILISKCFGKKVIIHIHGNYLKDSFANSNKLKKAIYKAILSLTNKGIVLSKSLQPNLTPFISESNIYPVYNFVEDYLLNETEEAIEKKTIWSLRIIYLSNLMEEKGINDLLEALSILKDKGVEYKAKIAGHIDKSSKEKIMNYFNNLPNIEYLGVVKGEEKKDMLLWGNVFVFPTYYKMEGQPISLIEAMASGNIIITTKHAGIPDIVTEKNGFFIDKKSPNGIVQKLEYIIKHKKDCQEIMYNNYVYAQKTYTTSNYISKLTKVFNSAI